MKSTISRFRFRWVVAFSFVLAPPYIAPAIGQEITVGIKVSGEENGVVGGEFMEALKGLAGEAVGTTTSPHYLVRLAVTCLPDPKGCSSASGYAVAFAITEPLGQSAFFQRPTELSPLVFNNVNGRPLPDTSPMEVVHSIWASSWSASDFRDRIAETVAYIDRRCFARRRLFLQWERVVRESGSVAAVELGRRLNEPNAWMCK